MGKGRALCFWMKMGQASSSGHSIHQHGWVLLKGGSRSSAILAGMFPVDQLPMCVCDSVKSQWDTHRLIITPSVFPITRPLVLSFFTKLWNLHAVNPVYCWSDSNRPLQENNVWYSTFTTADTHFRKSRLYSCKHVTSTLCFQINAQGNRFYGLTFKSNFFFPS